jgi:hypothetical protein
MRVGIESGLRNPWNLSEPGDLKLRKLGSFAKIALRFPENTATIELACVEKQYGIRTIMFVEVAANSRVGSRIDSSTWKGESRKFESAATVPSSVDASLDAQ